MRGDDLEKCFLIQIFSGHELAIGWFFRADYVLWRQPRARQQFLQFLRRQRMFQVIDALVLHALFSQDPLDFAACASGRLLVNRDCDFLFHGTLSPLRG